MAHRHYLLFDIDLTLLRTGGAGPAALTRAFEDLTGVPDALDEIEFMGRTDRWIVEAAAQRAGIPAPEAFAERYLATLAEALDREPAAALPGVPELLATLAVRDDTVLALGTGNLRDAAFIKLRSVGLHPYFEHGGFGDRHEDRASMLREAMDAVGWEQPHRLVVIGDSLHDVQGALAVGARAVAVATGWVSAADLHAAGADVVLRDLSDMPLVLRALYDDEPPRTDPGLLAEHEAQRGLV